MRLHGTRRVVLILHSDCGAYGGMARFAGDKQAEAHHHRGELQRATACLLESLPALIVDSYLFDFEGVWEMDRTPLRSSLS